MRRARVLCLLIFLAAQLGYAQQPRATVQETSGRIRQLVAAFQAEPGDYLIGSGDLLQIDVFDVPELSRQVRVSESGHISLPLIPIKVRAGGLTAFQLEEKLAELLELRGARRRS